MFRELRRTERKMDEADVIRLLEGQDYGVLSTASTDGYAYGVPLNYVYINNSIYFHCAVEGHKTDNITVNNKVSFCVVGEIEVLPDKFSTRYQSVIVFGLIEEVYGDEKHQALTGLLEKYSSQYMEKGMKYIDSYEARTKVLKLNIEHISGKARK